VGKWLTTSLSANIALGEIRGELKRLGAVLLADAGNGWPLALVNSSDTETITNRYSLLRARESAIHNEHYDGG
jgi:hypothetical protein